MPVIPHHCDQETKLNKIRWGGSMRSAETEIGGGEIWSDTGHRLISLRAVTEKQQENVYIIRGTGKKKKDDPRPGATYGCQYIEREKRRYEKKTTNTVKTYNSRNRDRTGRAYT